MDTSIVKTLTTEQLREEMQIVDYERTELVRTLAGQMWTTEDTESYERMNQWAAAVHAELTHRTG